MYVWDSRTGFLLHEFDIAKVRAGRRTVDELTSLAWNHDGESKEFMFCTGHVSGNVGIWTSTHKGNSGKPQRRKAKNRNIVQ